MAIGKINLGRGAVGVAPTNVKNIKAKTGNGKITISWEDPENTYDTDGNLLCEWKGTKLVQKLGAYPKNVYDGNLIVDNQVKNAYSTNGFVINNLTNDTTYYYSLFPYSTDNVTNKNEANRITATPKAITIYGVKRLKTATNSTWERIEGAEGLVANATHDGTEVQNDFDNLYPWSDIISYNYDTTTQEVKAYYGDATFKFDGSNGDVLTKIPEFWWKKASDNEYDYIYIADGEVEDFIKAEEFSLGRYTISGNTSKVSSKSGVSPFCNKTITNYRDYAKALGTGFGIMDWRYFLIQLLYLVEYADYNSQNILGNGNTSNNSGVISSGGCNNLGMKSGCITNDSKHSVIYRGLEDIFGNIYQFVDGINIKSRKAYVCYDPTKYVVDKYSGDYQALSYNNGSSDGYSSKLGFDSNNPLISFPTETSGSSTTGTCDYYYQSSSNYVVWVGGCYSDSTSAGLWYWSCYYTSSNYSSNLGARLLRYQ